MIPALLLLLPAARALTAADAGRVDWHAAALGVLSAPHVLPDAGLVVGASDAGVLGALHLSNGSIAWRHAHDAADAPLATHVLADTSTLLALSGPSGATLRTYALRTGALLNETRLHAPRAARLLEPPGLGAAFASAGAGGATFVLTQGSVVHRVGGEGWRWASEDETSSIIYTALHATPSTIYLAGLQSGVAGYTPYLTALDASSGAELSSHSLSGAVAAPGASGPALLATPRGLVWLEPRGALRAAAFDAPKKIESLKGSWAELRASSETKTSFAALAADGSATVLSFGADGFRPEHAMAAGPDASYSPASAARISHDAPAHTAHVQTLAGPSYALPFDASTHGAPTAAHADNDNAHVLLTTSAGSVLLYTRDEAGGGAMRLSWARDESTARTVVGRLVPLPAPRGVAEGIKREAHEGAAARVARHVADLQNLPAYILHFVGRFLAGSYETPSTHLPSTTLERDAFGFRMLFVGGTAHGTVYALDASTGARVWSRVLEPGVVVREIFDVGGEGGAGRAVLVAVRTDAEGVQSTLVYDLDALTGALSPAELFAGRPLAAHLLPLHSDAPGGAVLLVDESRNAYIHPDTPATRAALSARAPHMPLRFGGSVTGHTLVALPSSSADGAQPRWALAPTWTHAPPQGELPTALIARADRGALPASLGKVLGNRTTLYKALNPHAFALLTAGPDACGVRVLDGVSGALLYHARLPKPAHGPCDVSAALVENWLVYTYWDPEYAWVGQSKARRLVSAELYEGAPDERTRSAELSSFDEKAARVTVYEAAYVFPHGVRALGTTSTRFGVSARDLLVATDKNGVQTFPRVLLNPRRPKLGKDGKQTAEMAEEMLIPYDAVLPDDPRRVVSHVYDVAGVREIVSAPTLLESTAVVCAYGLDLFCTRVAPSRTFDVLSPSFNKAQLVLTVIALAAGIVVVRPMVRRKALRERWYVRG